MNDSFGSGLERCLRDLIAALEHGGANDIMAASRALREALLDMPDGEQWQVSEDFDDLLVAAAECVTASLADVKYLAMTE